MSEADDLHARLSETNRLIARGHTVEEALRRTAVSRPVFITWLKDTTAPSRCRSISCSICRARTAA